MQSYTFACISMLHTLCGKIGKSLHEAAPNTCSFGLRPLVEPVLHISIPFTPFPVLHARMSVGSAARPRARVPRSRSPPRCSRGGCDGRAAGEARAAAAGDASEQRGRARRLASALANARERCSRPDSMDDRSISLSLSRSRTSPRSSRCCRPVPSEGPASSFLSRVCLSGR